MQSNMFLKVLWEQKVKAKFKIMNNGTQHHIRNNSFADWQEGEATAPTIGKICRLDENTERCKRDTERPPTICTRYDASNSILKCQFLPKLNVKDGVQYDKKATKTERDFYKSLSKVASKHNITSFSTANFPYPYNISLGMWDMQTKLKENILNWDVLCLARNKNKSFLAITEYSYIETGLYYIPVIPLFKMLKDPLRKRNAHLLLSVFSYLYNVANIPYYRDESSYLSYLYMIHWELAENDEEEEANSMTELLKAEIVGDIMLQKLGNTKNLELFEKRLNCFKIQDEFDQECWIMASKFFALFLEYPTATIFRNSIISESDHPYDDDDRIIRMDQYISFVSDFKGLLYENIKESVNNEFNECSDIEVPTIFKPIDGSRIKGNTLEFEKSFFDLLIDLCSLFMNIK